MSIFSKLLGSSKKDATYQGPKPITSLTEVKGGPEYYKTIQDRLAGRGVGFGDDYAQKYASPIIANTRGNFESYALPELKSELSATGRRKGTAGFSQLEQAYRNQNLNENDIFSRLQQRNEDQMRSEINDSFGRLGDFANNEANLHQNYVNFEKGSNDQQVAREDQRVARESAGYQDLLNKGLQAAGYGLSSFGAPSAPTVSYGGQRYPISTPPQGYDYSNIRSRLVARQGQLGRAA